MGRRKKQPPKPYQRRPHGSSHFMQLYDDLLDSKAYHALSARQKVLYLYCVRESHGQAMRDNAPEGGMGDERLFYMNRALRVEVHELYAKSDTRGFERDMAALVSVGLVDCVTSGYAAREKSVYRLSSRWHHYGTRAYSLPESCKTLHMKIAEDKEKKCNQKQKDPAPEHHAIVPPSRM